MILNSNMINASKKQQVDNIKVISFRANENLLEILKYLSEKHRLMKMVLFEKYIESFNEEQEYDFKYKKAKKRLYSIRASNFTLDRLINLADKYSTTKTAIFEKFICELCIYYNEDPDELYKMFEKKNPYENLEKPKFKKHKKSKTRLTIREKKIKISSLIIRNNWNKRRTKKALIKKHIKIIKELKQWK